MQNFSCCDKAALVRTPRRKSRKTTKLIVARLNQKPNGLTAGKTPLYNALNKKSPLFVTSHAKFPRLIKMPDKLNP